MENEQPIAESEQPLAAITRERRKPHTRSGRENAHHRKKTRLIRKAQRIRIVTQLALEDHTYDEISEIAGVSLRTIARIIPAFRKECVQKATEDTREMIAKSLARYNSIYREAMAAWRRSQENKEVRVVEDVESVGPKFNPDGTPNIAKSEKPRKKRSTRTEGQAGDAALLARAESAQAKIDELMGLCQPKKTEFSGHIQHDSKLTVCTDDDWYGNSARLFAASPSASNRNAPGFPPFQIGCSGPASGKNGHGANGNGQGSRILPGNVSGGN